MSGVSERFPSILVEQLADRHNRGAFACGNVSLDRYLREQSGQDERRDVARVYVGVTPGEPEVIAGYYTLSATSIVRVDLPESYARRLPRVAVPAAIIGRLAVSQTVQGRRIGTYLLMNAIERTIELARTIAINALIVDAIDDSAAAFYRRHGFIALPASGHRLYVPVATLRKLSP